MSLQNCFLGYRDGFICVFHMSTSLSEPKERTTFWPILGGKVSAYESLSWPIGEVATDLGGGEFRLPGGRTVMLDEGGNTAPIAISERDVDPPKTPLETRWHNGRWERLTKKGWRV